MISTALKRRTFAVLLGAAACALGGISASAQAVTLNYGHMNSPSSIAGLQATWLAEEVAKNTGGEVNIEVYPSSQLGKIQELAEGVSTGSIALSHNTAGGIGSLYAPFAALDTPYLYDNVDHLMKVVDVNSPVMQELNKGLIENSGVRVLYAFYFGTRQLTADRAIKEPADLAGVKIRAIPFPIYLSAVEGLGAVPVPVDWSEVPTALATGIVSGQENPVNVVLDHKIYDIQSHLMLTGHISAAEMVVINEDIWQSFSPETKDAITKAAQTVRERATQQVLNREAEELQSLKDAGMTVIGPQEGLQTGAFRSHVQALVKERFSEEYGDLYSKIEQAAH